MDPTLRIHIFEGTPEDKIGFKFVIHVWILPLGAPVAPFWRSSMGPGLWAPAGIERADLTRLS